MGIFNSGVGKRSRRYAMAMMENTGHQREQVEAALRQGTSGARNTLKSAYTSGRGMLSDAFRDSQSTLQGGQQASQDFLQAGFSGALGRSDAGFDQARQDLVAGRDAALGTTSSGYAEALAALQQRYGQAGEQLQGAVNAWDPLLQQGQEGLNRYSNLINGALGAGTPEERAAAEAAFRAGPGYQWQLNQGVSAAQRAANAVGSSASGGNALDAVTRLSSRLADQEYQDWIGNLTGQQTGYRGQTQTATAGRASALTNLGGLYQQQAGQESGLITDRTNKLSDIHTTSGNNLASNSQAQGTAAAGILTDQGKTMATNATNYATLLSNLRTQYGQDQTNLRTSYGSNVAGLQTGLAGALASSANNYWNGINQSLGVALQGSNQQGAETASWGQGLLSLGSNILGLGMSGGGTVGGNFLGSLFK